MIRKTRKKKTKQKRTMIAVKILGLEAKEENI